MERFAKFVCKNKKMILIVAFILLLLSFVGMKLTKINYDVLVYLPQDIETVKGQNILTDDFGIGSYSVAMTHNLDAKDILNLEDKIKKIDGVNEVISAYDLVGFNIPITMMPNDIRDKVNDSDTDFMLITFKDSTSNENTINAVKEIREVTGNKIKQGGMSSMVLDTMELSEKEITIYVIIAVLLCLCILEFALDSHLLPIIILVNIGFAIMFNLGSNVFLGEISYITKALVAVLQLGVTTDFSIFLYHSYQKKKKDLKDVEKAMVAAIKQTFSSVTGSSLTTIAGFLVLCMMTLTLGKDLGIVMAKGVLLGVICVLTLLPSLFLIFDGPIEKLKHKSFMPNFDKFNRFIVKYNKVFLTFFVLLFIPLYLAYSNIDVYYKLDKSLPDTLESIATNETLKEKFNIVSPEIILVDKSLKIDSSSSMIKELNNVPGMDFVLSSSDLDTMGISKDIFSDDMLKIIQSDDYQLIIINSIYEVASDELNEQIGIINGIIKKYDKHSILAGEGALMKDLVSICDIDFNNVNESSIICIFIILFIVLRSVSLPFLLIVTIEFAIFGNMSISYFGGTVLPFIAPIVLGTIQLGATVDYAILMTNTYLRERKKTKDKKEAMVKALNYSGSSILVSGMCFFAATCGVGIYSDIEMIGALCALISRGALISMIVVITVLPGVLLTFDKLIMKTTLKGSEKKMKNKKKVSYALMFITILMVLPFNVNALYKNETVYSKLNSDGSIKNTFVNERLLNSNNSNIINDYSELKDILNLGNDNEFKNDNGNLVWNANGKDIYYQGTINKNLPVGVKINYYLNGKKYKTSDMLGKSGDVVITIKYINRDRHNIFVNNKYKTLYTPFLVTMGMILDDSNSSFDITNGKVMNNGVNNVIVGMATPGLYESLNFDELNKMDTITIKYTTKKFELPNIYNVVVPKLINNDDLNIFNKMDSLYKKSSELQKSMNKIDESAKKVASGSKKLKDGLSGSIEKLKSNNGSALSSSDVEKIKSTTVSSVNTKFTSEYKKQIGEVASSSIKESDTYKQFENGINQLNQAGITDQLVSICTSSDVPTSYQQICISNASYITKYQTLKQMMTLMEEVAKEVAISSSYNAALETASSVSEELAPTVADTVKNEIINTMTSSLDTLYDGVSELDNGINKLSRGITTYNKQGIENVTKLINNEVKDKTETTEELINLSNQYESFGSKNNNISGETKFILVVDGKKAPEKVKTIKTKSKTSFWERVKNLFK